MATDILHSAAGEAAPDWSAAASNVIPIEKGVAVATAERRAAAEKPNDGGLSVRIPLRDIVQLVGAVLAVAAIVWTLRSDIRDIKTSQTYEFQLIRQAAAEQAKVQDERWKAQTETNRSISAEQRMQGLTLDDIELALAKAGIYTAPKKGGG